MPRTIAIGDMHGCATALRRLLQEIDPAKEDTIIGIGDYVDRGMESAQVLEILIDLVTKTRFVPLIGNHELMMYQGLFNGQQDFEFWFQHGGNATLASYGGRAEDIPQHHVTFLSHCIRFFETDTHFFVHANYLPDVPLAKMPDETIFWQHLRTYMPPPHLNGKIAVVGHTPQPEGDVVDYGHIKAIDTYCYGDQWLSALDVNSGKVWQANNLGEFRTAEIDPGADFDSPASMSNFSE
ncbi:MAG: metallophosphoesterase family protein [Planctomycetota bacterium]